MNLAFAIVFLWLGGALLFVAFHGLKDIETSSGTPSDVVKEIQAAASKHDNAYGA